MRGAALWGTENTDQAQDRDAGRRAGSSGRRPAGSGSRSSGARRAVGVGLLGAPGPRGLRKVAARQQRLLRRQRLPERPRGRSAVPDLSAGSDNRHPDLPRGTGRRDRVPVDSGRGSARPRHVQARPHQRVAGHDLRRSSDDRAGQDLCRLVLHPRYAVRLPHGYFTNQALTVGPITALRAVDGNPNGVFCYDDQNCGFFPVHGHRDSTYWVTPLWQTPTTTDPVEPVPSPHTAPTPPGQPPTANQLAPRVSGVAPVPGATGVKVTAIVKATFSEPVRRATLSTTSVRLLRKGSTKAVPARLSYDATGGASCCAHGPRCATRLRTASSSPPMSVTWQETGSTKTTRSRVFNECTGPSGPVDQPL